MEDLAAAVRTHQPNETVTIVVLRGGKQLSIQVTLDKLKN
jgi:S1-C subfamily serine protease